TTYMIRSILENAGHKVGLIGTIEAIIGEEHIPALNTTPESYLVQEYFRRMADAGCDTVVMEVSSQALMLHRTQGFVFDYGIFTNIEPDHIGEGEHRDFEHYLSCKALLLSQCRVGIVNRDDAHFDRVIRDHTCQLETYGFSDEADLRAKDARLTNENGVLGIAYRLDGLMDFPVQIDIPGKFSIYNSLTAIALCRHFGVSREDICRALAQAKVKGRIEMVKVSDDFTLMIDYAHNAMALESLLTTLKEYHPARLVCLFGCGGNRSRLRRFEMGEVSGRLADLTIITSDNPRDEEPQAIIDDIKTGIGRTQGKYIEIPDRREAIAYAIDHGQKGDIIVLAGKGHEDYQEIKGKKYPMDERVIIADILRERA
ncbi:MAG: UDP-N-acetylmuramoyl-L-alanyl-D-glutamate--2,6-diaminopimelate ligase, partial [Blautia sp.]|nr:UDP-N-acetylmuramoyl-L-alanyl-D-glutamate--2,6-diaminopimelate ligase [Blautia sp.]